MFNKTKPTAPAPKPQSITPPLMDEAPAVAPVRAKPAAPVSKPQSMIGSGLLIDGNILGNSDLLLDGTVRGDVKVAHLIVGESGNIEGKVEAESIEIRGRVVGSVQGKHVRLLASAYVEGDITHDQLSIDVGAFFQGRCQQNRPAPVAPASPVVAAVAEAPAPIRTPSAAFTSAPADNATPSAVAPSLDAYDLGALSDLKS